MFKQFNINLKRIILTIIFFFLYLFITLYQQDRITILSGTVCLRINEIKNPLEQGMFVHKVDACVLSEQLFLYYFVYFLGIIILPLLIFYSCSYFLLKINSRRKFIISTIITFLTALLLTRFIFYLALGFDIDNLNPLSEYFWRYNISKIEYALQTFLIWEPF